MTFEEYFKTEFPHLQNNPEKREKYRKIYDAGRTNGTSTVWDVTQKFILQRLGNSIGSFQHETLESARDEALRLAKKELTAFYIWKRDMIVTPPIGHQCWKTKEVTQHTF